MIDCRQCKYSVMSYSSLLCKAENLPKPVEYMRDPRSSCGLEAILFEPKQERKYSEFED